MKETKSRNKELVRLRERKLSNGNKSLYLDYNNEGKRKFEFLKLYLIVEKNPQDKKQNKETLKLAQAIKAEKTIELQNETYGYTPSYNLDQNFLDYFQQLTNERNQSEGNYGNWRSCLQHLKRYCKASTTFKDVDKRFIEGFRYYLENKARTPANVKLSQNSQSSYFNKLKACVRHANEEEIIPTNPALLVKGIKSNDPEREYLTLDELKKLAHSECRYPVLKRAFIFSCLTGMRWSDINKLTWQELYFENETWRIIFRQKKTKGLQYLDINKQARQLIGEQPKDRKAQDKIFMGLKYSTNISVELQKWCLKAGIPKTITFHCGRHTFAVMQLTLGTEIYTVSKLLGHSELKTTEIYAKIVDSKKREAINRIPDIDL